MKRWTDHLPAATAGNSRIVERRRAADLEERIVIERMLNEGCPNTQPIGPAEAVEPGAPVADAHRVKS